MRLAAVAALLFLLLSAAVCIPCTAQEGGAHQGAAAGPAAAGGSVSVSAGLPEVTPEGAVQKVTDMAMNLHSFASNVAPMASIVIIVLAALAGMIVRKALMQVVYVAVGLVVVLWAPYLVALMVKFLKP